MKPALAALLLLAAPAAAQSVGDCGDLSLAQYLPEPWEAHTATYAAGKVRIAVLDTHEPAAAATHLLVMSPPLDEIGGRQCRIVSLQADAAGGRPTGFLNVGLPGRETSYDPAVGLVLAVPVEVFAPSTGGAIQAVLTLKIDQSSGAIDAAMETE